MIPFVGFLKQHYSQKACDGALTFDFLRGSLMEVVQTIHRSDHRPKVLYRIGALENFPNFAGKLLCQSLFLINLQAVGLQLY